MPSPKAIKTFVERRVELQVILALLVAACGIWAFVALAGEVLEGDTEGLDQEILLAFRSASDPNEPLGPRMLEVFGRDMTAFGGTGVLMMVTAFASLYLFMQDKWRTAVIVIAAIASGFAMSQLLKWGFSRPRPDLVPHGTHAYTASFPSGHAMMSAVTYLTLSLLTSRVEPRMTVRIFLVTCAVILTVLVGVSRVYLAVHWPSDVLAGWTMGAAWAIGWWFVARWVDRTSNARPEGSDTAATRQAT